MYSQHDALCEKAAQRWDVSPDVHSDDFIFKFLLNNASFESKDKAVENYFEDGRESAQRLYKILTEVCGFDDKPFHMLEFASGYGRMTRHVKNVLPFCSLTACDIHEQAIRFVEDKLEIKAILSATEPEDLHLHKHFDVVFALSFFSHIPKSSFSRWLEKMVSIVKPEGFLVFTTHGMVSQKYFPNCKLDEDGFYFYPKSEQNDLDGESYGSTVVRPRYVLNQLFKISNVTLKHFQEGYWWGHQDVYIVRRV